MNESKKPASIPPTTVASNHRNIAIYNTTEPIPNNGTDLNLSRTAICFNDTPEKKK